MRHHLISGLIVSTFLTPAAVVQAQTFDAFSDLSNEELLRRAEQAETAKDDIQAEAIWRYLLDRLIYDIPIGDSSSSFYVISTAEAYDRLGFALANQGKYAEAADAHREAIQLDPNFGGSYFYLGNALLGQNNLIAAEQAFRQSINVAPDIDSAYLSLGDLLIGQKRYSEAAEVYGTATLLTNPSSSAYYGLGNSLYYQELYSAAENAFREAILISPEDPFLHWRLGTTLDKQERHEEAIEAFQMTLRLNPNDDIAYQDLGYVLLDLGRYQESENSFRMALQIDSNNFFTNVGLGDALIFQERYEEAESVYRKAVAIDNSYSFAYKSLGDSLHAQGRYAEAKTEYQNAIRLNSRNPETYNSLGVALENLGDHQEAEDAYRSAIRIDSNHKKAHNNLGVLLVFKERYEEAEVIFRQSLNIEPDAVNLLYLSLLAAERQDFQEAETISQRLLSLDSPTNGLGYLSLGLIYKEQNRIEESISAFEQALNIYPEAQILQDNLNEAKLLLTSLDTTDQPNEPSNSRFLALKRGIVRIRTETLAGGPEYGTGWVIKRENNRVWIITNCHVIDVNLPTIEDVGTQHCNQPNDTVSIEFFNRSGAQDPVTGRILQAARSQDGPDLALVVIENAPEEIQPLELGNSRQLTELSDLVIIGHPASALFWTTEPGRLSNNQDSQQLQISQAALGPGNSGSPVFNEADQVVGIVFSTVDASARGRTAGFGYAYRVEYIEPFLRQWGVF